MPSTGRRCYAAQTALAASPEPAAGGQSSHGLSSTTDSPSYQGQSRSRKNRPELDVAAKAERARVKVERAQAKVAESAAKAARKSSKDAQEAERRRKALSILDKTTKFVATVNQTSHEPTLADLERFKPKNPPLITLKYIYPEPSSRLHRGSPSDAVTERYSAAHHELVDVLTKRFRRQQLLRLLKEGMRQRTGSLLGTPRPFSRLNRAHLVAEEILRWLWHWPYVTEVNERKAYLTARSERVFPLKTSEFFLLLGPDGSLLLALTESYGVIVKEVERSQDAFSVVIEGPSYMLDALATVLTERKNAMISELVHVVSPDQSNQSPSGLGVGFIRPDLMKRISRLSNAFVEDKGNGMFRISAHRQQNIAMAVRLATRAYQQATLPPSPLLVYLPTLKDSTPGMLFPHMYAFFPFELPNAEALPWLWASTGTLSAQSSSARRQAQSTSLSTAPVTSSGTPYLFRARKISDWLEQTPADTANRHRGLREGVGRLLSSAGQPHTLRDALRLPDLASDLPRDQHSRQRTITALTGHIAFSAALGLRSTPTPPLRGSWIFPKLLDWMGIDKGRATFIPSPPQPLIASSPSNQIALNRLVYRSPSTDAAYVSSKTIEVHSAESLQTLKFEMLLPQPAQNDISELTAGDAESRQDGNKHDTSMRSMYDDKDAPEQQSAHSEDSPDIQPSERETVSADTPVSSQGHSPRLQSGVETFVNVMLPDRPMDMQLSSFDAITVPRDSEPSELLAYALDLAQHFSISDAASRPDPPLHVTYEGTRYVLHTNAIVRRSSQLVADDSPTDTESPMDVLTEHIIDLESDEKLSACTVTYAETNALTGWQKFLGDCDGLTWLTAKKEMPSASFSENENTNDTV